jgi:hypothetical protein
MESTIEKERIKSWDELASWLQKYRDQGWLFRGEQNPNFKFLRPKVGRAEGSKSPRSYPYTLEDEKLAFQYFKKSSRAFLSTNPQSDIEWLALAQHHGLPTRLLDWTDSLFIAAFFAVENAGSSGSRESGGGVIYCVRDIPEIDEYKEGHENLFDLKEVRLYRPPHISPRIAAQQSVFTLHSTPTENFTHPTLQRWVIDKNACWKIKRNLVSGGISYSSLFPDIDGLCKHIGWMYKWSFFSKDRNHIASE